MVTKDLSCFKGKAQALVMVGSCMADRRYILSILSSTHHLLTIAKAATTTIWWLTAVRGGPSNIG
jgi:hypothetical protein